ncbi:MAG: hypothetical protein KGH61_00995 [Candidatus Micrarchaeota archaeon]|nr:hypothetical protein [Candidatus Micrarchaeota archaeon]MDE1847511.1 hypothetical protein [Candidatus Micrarchaeota archaeon]MDE1863853.1 hypothetical protein [Candidatus Micrarchaeota archaeon]
MKLQSSIEFLLTYSFLFLLVGVIMSFLFFFATAPKAIIPSSCQANGGIQCNTAIDYVNQSGGYSLITISLSNMQSVPINLSGVQVTINTANSIAGGCVPFVLYPGQSATCIAAMTQTPTAQSTVNGFFSVNALYCNSGLLNLANGCIGGTNVQYGGSFSITAIQQKTLVFSVQVGQSPTTQQSPIYPASPLSMPGGYINVQNGEVTALANGYGFGTANYINQRHVNLIVGPFPSSVSALNAKTACSGIYNTTYSIASTAIYVPAAKPSSPVINAYADNGMEVFYRTSSKVWSNVLDGSLWSPATGVGTAGPDTITLSTGAVNYLAIDWYNSCGDGVQMLSIHGLTG